MFITSIEEGGYRPYEFKDDIQLSVVFERDLDLHRVDREVYSVLDLLGDVGGLYEATKMICFTILYLTNFMSFENYLVSELFKKDLNTESKTDKK